MRWRAVRRAQVFGPDDVKFRSCLTLFHRAAPEELRFSDALAKYFAGELDDATLQLLAATFGAAVSAARPAAQKLREC